MKISLGGCWGEMMNVLLCLLTVNLNCGLNSNAYFNWGLNLSCYFSFVEHHKALNYITNRCSNLMLELLDKEHNEALNSSNI